MKVQNPETGEEVLTVPASEFIQLTHDFIWLFENSNLNMDAMKTERAIEINKLYQSLMEAKK